MRTQCRHDSRRWRWWKQLCTHVQHTPTSLRRQPIPSPAVMTPACSRENFAGASLHDPANGTPSHTSGPEFASGTCQDHGALQKSTIPEQNRISSRIPHSASVHATSRLQGLHLENTEQQKTALTRKKQPQKFTSMHCHRRNCHTTPRHAVGHACTRSWSCKHSCRCHLLHA